MLLRLKENEVLIAKVLDEFSAATNLASVVVDIHGDEVSQLRNFTTFCKIMRANPKYRPICQKCDLFGGLETSKSGTPFLYQCHAGLIAFSVPIIVKNQLIGFFSSGQIICEDDKDLPFIYPQQTDWKNDKELIAAYRSVPTFSEKRISSSAEMLKIISNYYLKTEMETIQSEENKISTLHYSKETRKPKKKKEIKKALQYIHKHLNRPITLEEVSNHIYLSPYYFCKLFKKEMGINFIDYINEKKMELAKEMLINTRLSINNIANNLGFSQTSYFCKVFRKKWNITPKSYRESLLHKTKTSYEK